MLFKTIIFGIINVYCTNAALFLWSTHELKISPLEEYATEEFSETVKKFNNPDVFIFRSPNFLSNDIQPVVNGYFSTYCPNGLIESENTLDLSGNPQEDIKIIQETIGNSKNFLSAIIIPNYDFTARPKRQLTESNSEEAEMEKSKEEAPTGPVIYKKSKITKNNIKLYALLYSSKPLLFKRNDTNSSEIYLGNTQDDLIIYDARLNINIPLNGRGKIALRFSFSWKNSYWSMPSVKVTDTQNNKEYNLITSDDVSAQEYFSYHCNGETMFKDSSGAELYLYDLQVQIDSKNGKFGDANDCVPFITVPIWSGIFITFILGIGMVIALMAIMDIKTMDKFDNYKTKNLVITVSD